MEIGGLKHLLSRALYRTDENKKMEREKSLESQVFNVPSFADNNTLHAGDC